VCSNGACATECRANVPCTDGIGPCRRGATSCSSATSQPQCRDVGADDSRNTCGRGQECRGGTCVASCQSGGSCTDGIAPCRKGTFVCNQNGQRECRDDGVDGAAEGRQQRCSGGNICRGGACAPPCTPGVGPQAGCPGGQYCDTSVTPRKCVPQVRNGQPCQSCTNRGTGGFDCHQGNKSGVLGECENGGGCGSGGVISDKDFCCDPRADLCQLPGVGCCSFEGEVPKCTGDELEDKSCASFSCNRGTGRCN
jgi:hypothetical protein